MNFNQLLIFHKVAEKKHFTRAAEELFISQPAVSKQVQELEKTLKQPLFTRIGQKVYLTEAGRVLYEYADRIFALADEAEAALNEMQNLERGRLTVGASTTIGTYLLPELLGQYKARYPQIELFADIGNTGEIQEKVRGNRLEVGLIEGSVTHPGLFQKAWRQDQLVLIASPRSSLVDEESLTLHQLLQRHPPFILREPGSGTREMLEKALAAQEEEAMHSIMELGSTEAIKRAVSSGLGLAFVSEHTILLEVAAGLLKRISLVGFEVQRPLSIVLLQGKRLSKAAQVFLELIE